MLFNLFITPLLSRDCGCIPIFCSVPHPFNTFFHFPLFCRGPTSVGPHKHTHAHSLGGPHHIKVRNVGLAAIMYECMDLVMPSLPFFRCGVCGGVVCVLLHAISEPSFMFTHFESALKCQSHYPESMVLLKCYNSQTDLGTPGPVCLVPLLVMLITVLRHLMSFFAFFLSDFPFPCSQT